ncbi:MAG TPA: DUF427 domain-containing protein [Nitriliruptorales bacterium]
MAKGRVRVENGPKRIRVLLGGEWVADTTNVKLVWEKPYYPTYYFPSVDVRTDLLVDTGQTHRSPSRGESLVHDVKTEQVTAEAAASWFQEADIDEIVDHVRFDWASMDAWFEEDEEVYVHPRDPYTRIDVLQSSRHVVVEVDGVVIADSTSPRLLFETGLPTRYYLPKTDVRMDLLTPTSTHTACPYKGQASYYSVTVDGTSHDDLAWWYPSPLRESEQITGYLAFYNEKVDLIIDGERFERPRTKFS